MAAGGVAAGGVTVLIAIAGNPCPFRPYDGCGKIMPARPFYFSEHLKQHTYVYFNFCDDCGRSFSTPPNLNKHLLTHVFIYYNVCDDCGSFTLQSKNSEIHVRTHYRTFYNVCDDCGEFFKQKTHLEAHAFTHTGVYYNVCDDCGLRTRDMLNMNKHIGQHSHIYYNVCDDCGYFSKQSSSLSAHADTHSHIYYNVCDDCGYFSKQSSSLAAHVITHCHIYYNVCDDCGHFFHHKKSLSSHVSKRQCTNIPQCMSYTIADPCLIDGRLRHGDWYRTETTCARHTPLYLAPRPPNLHRWPPISCPETSLFHTGTRRGEAEPVATPELVAAFSTPATVDHPKLFFLTPPLRLLSSAVEKEFTLPSLRAALARHCTASINSGHIGRFTGLHAGDGTRGKMEVVFGGHEIESHAAFENLIALWNGVVRRKPQPGCIMMTVVPPHDRPMKAVLDDLGYSNGNKVLSQSLISAIVGGIAENDLDIINFAEAFVSGLIDSDGTGSDVRPVSFVQNDE